MWNAVLLVFLGLPLVWFVVCITGMWVGHGWCTIPGSAARRRCGFWQWVLLIDGVKGYYASMEPGHAASMLVRCWDPTGVHRDHVDPDDTELDGLLSDPVDGRVAALTVFTPGRVLDVTALQVTRANIQITGSTDSITTLSEFHSDEPIFGV